MCPRFLPGASLPLTGLFTGCCVAEPAATISMDTLRECCNRGYARHACSRAAEIEEDAINFLVKADRGDLTEVAWAVERNHHPVQVGTANVPHNRTSVDPLAAQLFAIAEQYRSQKGGA